MGEFMLHLYSASDFGLLVEQYQKASTTIERAILVPQPLIVSNMKLAKWLSLQLASRQGIDANNKLILPAEYSWQLSKQLNPQHSKESDFSYDIMLLRIYAIFEDEAFCANFPRLMQYLSQCESVDWMKLALRTATLFESYQIFRTDWLKAWENGQCLDLGDDESWQQAIWQRLVESSSQSPRYLLHQQLIDTLKNSPEKLQLPNAICFFGISYLPPSIVELIDALSTHIDVHVFAFSPTTNMDCDAEPALHNWQSVWQDLSVRLAKEKPQIIEETTPPSTNLKRLKQSIAGQSVKATNQGDGSITIVSCFSPMREVEALHDYLLHCFNQDASLTASDILVVTPELEKYAPFVRSVFESSDKKLPYQFADSQGSRQSALLTGLGSLLEIATWRFTREQVQTLLSNRQIQNKFDFSDADLEQIDTWLDQAAIHWGIDAEHKADLGLPADEQNSWRSGLDRLLLGFALPCALASDLPLFGEENILPADEVDSAGSEKLSRFIDYCERLFSWYKTAQQPKTFSQWQLALQTLLDDLFLIDTNEQFIYQQVLQAIDKMQQSAEQAQLTSVCDLDTMVALLENFLPESETNGRLTGSINFAGMSSLAGVPFKKICLLGMNYDSWPSHYPEPGFDLIQSNLKAGDRQRSQLERYQTLQFLFAAKDSVYISYTGHDIHSGEEKPASVLVSEVQDLAEQLRLPISTLNHPMHVFSQANYQSGLLQSHSMQWQKVATGIGQGAASLTPFFTEDSVSCDLESLSIDALLKFFRSPQKAYLEQVLGLYLYDASQEWCNAEPFELANFSDSTVRQGVLDRVVKKDADASKNALKMAQAAGVLPHGHHGVILHQTEVEKLAPQLEGIELYCQTEVLPAIPIELKLDVPIINSNEDAERLGDANISTQTVTLTGLFDGLRAEGFHLIVPDKLHNNRKVEFWLKHLILCCAKPQGVALVTRIICEDGVIEFHQVQEPQVQLSRWISAMLKGLSQPLAYHHRSSFKYAEVVVKNEADDDKGLNAAIKAWQDGFNYVGENNKPANTYIYRGALPMESEGFKIWAKLLLVPLLNCLEQSKSSNKTKEKN